MGMLFAIVANFIPSRARRGENMVGDAQILTAFGDKADRHVEFGVIVPAGQGRAADLAEPALPIRIGLFPILDMLLPAQPGEILIHDEHKRHAIIACRLTANRAMANNNVLNGLMNFKRHRAAITFTFGHKYLPELFSL